MKTLLFTLVPLALIPMLATTAISRPDPAPATPPVADGLPDLPGPVMTTSEVMLAQDNFPEHGDLDPYNLGSNWVRFDRAENTAIPPLNVPGDELQVAITPSPGAELLGPQLRWKMKANPLFDVYRTSEYGIDREGVAYGWSPGGDSYAFDLPDTGFLFPGDVVHYYFEAEERYGEEAGVATLPADTTGYSDFLSTSPYSSSFIMRALPGLRDDGMGGIAQPEILLWNDYGDLGGQDEWSTALDNLGLMPGEDYDIYYTNAPLQGVGNGLGGRAAVNQIAGYRTILYSSGNADLYTITDNVFSGDAGDDIGLLDAWLQEENKNLLLTGSNLACDLATNNGAAGVAFLGWPAITLTTCDVSPKVGWQLSPVVMPVPGNPVITQPECWVAYGDYPEVRQFDEVALAPGAILLAEFTGPGCTPGAYPGTVAATLANDPLYNSRVIYLPYDLMDIYDPMKALDPSAQRTRLLEDFLTFFGQEGNPANVAGVPDLSSSTAVTAAQPVSVFVLPNGAGDPLSMATILGGGLADATITLTLLDGLGQPIADYPAEDMWLETTMGGLRLCEGGGIADANTDANGTTTFSGPFLGGGHSDWSGGEQLSVVVAGDALTSNNELQIYFNSADINGDRQVDDADLVLFNSDLFGSYNYRSDFNWDGVVNILDIALFQSGMGAACDSLAYANSLKATVVIDVTPDDINAPWRLDGPEAYTATGNGDQTLGLLPIGFYTLTWQSVFGWSAPPPQTMAVAHADTIEFAAAYVPAGDITGITDVGNDQGRQVRIVFARSIFDAAPDTVDVTAYGIYRRQDLYKAACAEGVAKAGSAQDKILGWDFLGTVPAHGDSFYQCIMPTLCDSTADAGVCWSVFFVRTMTPDPLTFFDSTPDSGYSYDNLAPSVPKNLQVDFAAAGNELSWDENEEPDVQYYCVYRGLQVKSDSDQGELVQKVAGTSWTDDLSGAPGDAWDYFYWLTAIDFGGNESEQTAWVEAGVSEVNASQIPRHCGLYASYPNPFNPVANIPFGLSDSRKVSLKIFDISGRLVCTLVDQAKYPAGRHEVFWRGRDEAGRTVAAGIYFYRMQAGDFQQTRKMTLLK